ncbi:GntR family transcriptional regulator [Desulfovibrio sp. OttesenSCG-928-O18]|nr:GntR family transcriptional regulator [Desulfovibrio sp. OttesenSCG-928-O18]
MPDRGGNLSHREKVYRYVKDGIIAHKFLPGDMIYERALAEQLGVSRTPVREAIQALQEDGWLMVVPRRGTMVRALKRVDIEEIIQLRKIFGCSGIRLGGKGITAQDLAYMGTLILRQKEAAKTHDVVRFMAADVALHLAFVRLGGNRRLVVLAGNFLDHFQRMGFQRLKDDEEEYRLAIEEHKSIVKALADGDIERAEQEFINHLDHTREVLLTYLSSNGAYP